MTKSGLNHSAGGAKGKKSLPRLSEEEMRRRAEEVRRLVRQ